MPDTELQGSQRKIFLTPQRKTAQIIRPVQDKSRSAAVSFRMSASCFCCVAVAVQGSMLQCYLVNNSLLLKKKKKGVKERTFTRKLEAMWIFQP